MKSHKSRCLDCGRFLRTSTADSSHTCSAAKWSKTNPPKILKSGPGVVLMIPFESYEAAIKYANKKGIPAQAKYYSG